MNQLLARNRTELAARTPVDIESEFDDVEYRKSRRKRRLGVAATLAVAGVCVFPIANAYREDIADHNPEARIAVEQKLQEHLGWDDVNIRCDKLRDGVKGTVAFYPYLPFGDYAVASDVIRLNNSICDTIASMPSKEELRQTSLSTPRIVALMTATHERIHTTGMRDETTTECFAMQELPATLLAQGHTEAHVRKVAPYAQVEYRKNPRKYFSNECRVGGNLDKSAVDNSLSNAWLLKD